MLGRGAARVALQADYRSLPRGSQQVFQRRMKANRPAAVPPGKLSDLARDQAQSAGPVAGAEALAALHGTAPGAEAPMLIERRLA
ncbi:hypothetical protein [Burkholderia ubonensis]|uniref:hypothetical protein n=1 Tax=Burkholderia ubonensis TaxID=101571 RepID=UPI000AE564F5|nr:hypothetical protein [Burkholderia ubonensis]